MRMFRFLMITMVLAGMAAAQDPAAGKKETADKQVPGFDPAALDKTADPCANFYQYACGGWMNNNPIPADQPAWGRFNELAERNRTFLREILENAASASNRTPNQQKIGDFFASCMDEEAVNQKGTAALKPAFDRINAM